jgi:hypothetical protein
MDPDDIGLTGVDREHPDRRQPTGNAERAPDRTDQDAAVECRRSGLGGGCDANIINGRN